MKRIVLTSMVVTFTLLLASTKANENVEQREGINMNPFTYPPTQSVDEAKNQKSDKYVTVHASYYADKFHGRKTASGEIFDQKKLTVAHKTLPFGTKLKLRNPMNGVVIYVTVNDRGPFIQGRTLDLSKEGAKLLGILNYGVAKIEMSIIS